MALRRTALLAPLLFGVLLSAPARAHAALSFSPCPQKRGVQCATLTVPVDRSGAVQGTIGLHVERMRGHGRGAVVALNGGPGQTNTDSTITFARRLGTALRTHDLYVFDQRGTGASGAIHCPGVERGDPPAEAVPACAAALGPARNYYTTLASAQDMEALRQAIGVPRLALLGASYGTYVDQAYAGLFPTRVESLVLDSAFAPSLDADPFSLENYRALPGVLNSVCSAGQCRGIVSGFQRQAYSLLAKAASQPLSGTYYDAQGTAHHIDLTALGVASGFPNLDLRPNMRAELPRAVAGALHGDTATLARLAAGALAGTPVSTANPINETLNMVTNCEERDLGYSRTAGPDERIAQGRAKLAATPASAFTPFTPDIAFAVSLVPTCAYWPSLPQLPAIPTGRLPAVPALILHGDADLRTPLESAREVAARLPRARLLDVPNVGHAVLQGDDSLCALRAVSDFYGGHAVHACGRVANPYPPRPIAPTRMAAVAPVAGIGGTPGRVVQAVRLTVLDALEQIDPGIYGLDGLLAAGGLRGGSYSATARGVTLRGDVFVPGVAVNGFVPGHGRARLTVSGSLRGTLMFRQDGSLSGTLGGKRIRGRAPLARHTVGTLLARERAPRLATHGLPRLP